MTTLKKLLEKGYFPSEVPPPFVTRPYAELIDQEYGNLPPLFKTPVKAAKIMPHNRPRVGSLRRTLGLPNPIHQFGLSDEIVKSWEILEKHFHKSRLSLSAPVTKVRGDRALDPRYPMRDLPKRRARHRATSRYVVTTDITRFYHSIYTHSIPWALHTKEIAKSTKKDSKLLGNRLDSLVRHGQDDQTVGIPIGPDTSLVLAETILCQVDSELPGAISSAGFRYIDDFELGFSTRSHAEEALAILEENLNKYELALNPKKTNIIELPDTLEYPWVSELRTLRLHDDSNWKSQGYDLLRYFDRAFELAKVYVDEHVLNYAIQRINAVLVNKKNWSIYEDLMLQCILAEPGTLRFAFAQLTRYGQMGYRINRTRTRKVINSLVEIHSRQGHGNEVAWAIWAAIFFDVQITKSNAKRVSKMEDSVVALLALDARGKGVIAKDVNFDKWATMMTTDNLYEQQWLLAYEANIKGWLPSIGPRDHVTADAAFNYLKSKQVHFYDETILDRIEAKKLPKESVFLSLSAIFLKYE